MMTQNEWDQLEADIVAGKIDAKKALAHLIERGVNPHFAWENVFLILGGDDIIERNADGVEYYRCSGRPVAEVKAKMKGCRLET